jgi:hypothetical protein
MNQIIIFVMLFGCVNALNNCSDPIIDCSARGVCLPNKSCLCNDGYITWPTNNEYECNYKQTKKLGPFLCQFFTGFATGCGAFMLGQYDYAISELLLFVLFLTMLCAICCLLVRTESDNESKRVMCAYAFVQCTLLLTLLIEFALWFSTIIFIIVGGFTDKNGAPLGDF